MSDWTLLGFAALLLALNAFFVGAEFAVISARRSAIEPQAYAGSKPARIVIDAMERVSIMLATCQLGITVASLGLGAVGEPALAHLLEPPFAALGLPEHLRHPLAFVMALAIVVYLHVVLGEMIPKNIALAGPDRAALWLVPPLVAVTKVLKPFVVSLNWLANSCLRLLRIEPRDEVASAFTRAQVAEMVEDAAQEGLFDDNEKALLAGALSFDQDTVESVVIPVADVISARLGQTRGEIETIAGGVGFSRLPVVAGIGGAGASAADSSSAAEVEYLGYVHLKDVITADPKALSERLHRDVVRPLPAIALGATLRNLLETMQASQVHIAQVRRIRPEMDEQLGEVDPRRGELVGIVALEDVLGRLVGHIEAERP